MQTTRFFDAGIFVVGAVLLWIATRVVIPLLVAHDLEPLIAWFTAGGALVFVPLVVIGALVLRREHVPLAEVTTRLRLHRLSARDAWFVVSGTLVVFAGSGACAYLVGQVLHAPMSPPFLHITPLYSDRLWILGAWFPFWLLNIGAEEFLWRGVLLPRQINTWGRYAWLVQSLLWTLFHLSFGWSVMLMALPTLLVVPFVVSRTRNTWNGIIIHGLANGPPFVLIALGVITS